MAGAREKHEMPEQTQEGLRHKVSRDESPRSIVPIDKTQDNYLKVRKERAL
jgi:hypothetical protein